MNGTSMSPTEESICNSRLNCEVLSTLSEPGCLLADAPSIALMILSTWIMEANSSAQRASRTLQVSLSGLLETRGLTISPGKAYGPMKSAEISLIRSVLLK